MVNLLFLQKKELRSKSVKTCQFFNFSYIHYFIYTKIDKLVMVNFSVSCDFVNKVHTIQWLQNTKVQVLLY